jgi:putative flavoprotein involved in K+ transport
MSNSVENQRAVVVGGGPGGLAAAATLERAGVPALVVDRAESVGSSWRGHYERLHLHTVRWLSGLPHYPIPREYGRWVSRARVVDYLEQYARHHELRLRLGVTVEKIERGPGDDDRWLLGTSAGPLSARYVVVATGYNKTPFTPDWPGRFSGELIHASVYRTGAPYHGRDVLVVGTGNTGAEIAVDLVEAGAARVRVAVRTPPNILRRELGGLPSQVLGVLLRPLPAALVDGVAGAMARLTVGDLRPYGLPPAPRGAFTRVLSDGQIPILDVGFVDAVKARKLEIVGAVEGFDGAEVLLAGGARIRPDAVIAATGYRRGLEPLVGHLGLLRPDGLPRVHGPETHPDAPGLHFIGYSNPVSGNLREMAIDARRIARAVKRAERAASA